jgi:heme/copper-type cytochrome/quinol oxidase subunit 2
MSQSRHFTTRRGFIAATGFGSLGLYATWAAYGAAPLPFGHAPGHADPHADPHASHAMPGHAMPDMAGPHDDDTLTPDAFEERHAAFLQRLEASGGAVLPAMAGHDHGAAHAAAEPTEPVAIYLAAGRFAFEPGAMRLRANQPYRFHMLARDVAHGASIAFGSASRIVRLRPGTVTTLDLTFRAAGGYLLYCTVYCGPGHDAMHASLTVEEGASHA